MFEFKPGKYPYASPIRGELVLILKVIGRFKCYRIEQVDGKRLTNWRFYNADALHDILEQVERNSL